MLVLILPVATLLAGVFSIGNLARHNEMVALKALGISLYQIMVTLTVMGFLISVFSFILAEGIVAKANQKKEDIKNHYLDQNENRYSSKTSDIRIQEPPDKIITIGFWDSGKQIANQIKIEIFRGYRLISRIDSPSMKWKDGLWIVENGYKRTFDSEKETAVPILSTIKFNFQFSPKDLLISQIKPDEMGFLQLYRFIARMRQSGVEVRQWLTDLHLRISFPLSNLIIVLISVPLTYNRRKKSIMVGFGISLVICFFYFGIVKLGQTMGHNGNVSAIIAAWMGNGVTTIFGLVNLIKVRK
jgi:lipopolysaccharide export system permease protein